MDPQVTWGQLLDACQENDWHAAQEAASSLQQWLDRGGFPPETQPGRSLGSELNQAIVRATCRYVFSRSRDS